MNIEKSELERLYIIENKNDKEIANIYGLTIGTICNLRKKYGIKGINARHRERILNPVSAITPRQENIIFGSLLGDACLKNTSDLSAYLSFSHSFKQKDYILWLYEELKSLCISEPKSYISKGKYITYEFSTQSRSDLKAIRNQIYKPRKTVNQEWLNKLNELSLAIWFMDDGCLQYINKSKSVFSFATNSFSIEENYLLSSMLEKKFGIKSEIRPCNKKSGMQYNLFISDNSFCDFISLISPYIIESMQYKLPTTKRTEHLANNIEHKITKEYLQKLYYDEKLTQQQIANIIGVHKTTIRKYMNLFSIKARNLIDAQLNGKNNKCERNIKGQFSQLILNNEEEIKAKNLFNEIRKNSFPYIKIKDSEYYVGIIDRLCNSTSLEKNDDCFMYSKMGMDICSAYCPQIFSMATNGSKTPLEIFNDDDMLLDCIKRTIKFAKRDTITSVRQGLKTYKKNRCVTIFPPMWTKTILQETLNNNNLSLFDFSCGFGGRLLGSYASGLVNKYVGVDPFYKNITSHEAIYNIIQKHSFLKNRMFSANFIHSTAEDALLNINEKFDVILTSPPYFNKEIYDKNNSQCYIKYKNYDEWKNLWYRNVLEKSFSLLKDNGLMVIFASDCDGNPVGLDTFNILQTISQKNVNQYRFIVPSLEYYRNKSFKKTDTAWVVSK